MENKRLKVTSINTENLIYTCDDGNMYVMPDKIKVFLFEELQKYLYTEKEGVFQRNVEIKN